MIVLISILVISFIGISYIYSHAGQLEGNIFLRRFARMIVDSQAGGDVTSNRNSLYEIAWGFFRSSPLFGVGVGQFAVLEGSTDVHNTYLQVLCEQGIVGFIPYLISIIYTLFVSVTNIKRYPGKNAIIKFCFAVQLVYVFYCFTGNLNTNLFGYMIYYCAIGIQFAYFSSSTPSPVWSSALFSFSSFHLHNLILTISTLLNLIHTASFPHRFLYFSPTRATHQKMSSKKEKGTVSPTIQYFANLLR